MGRCVNLIIPGLFKSFQSSELDSDISTLPLIIQRVISKSDQILSGKKNTVEFPVDYIDQVNLASYEYFNSRTDENSFKEVIYADPIALELKTDHIVAHPIIIKHTDHSKLKHIAQVFNQHFEEDGLSLDVLENGRIICASLQQPFAKSIPVYNIYGRDIKHFLPETSAANAKFWLRVFNETQMLLHESINIEDRVFNGNELNSLWFWGGNSVHKNSDLGFVGDSNWLSGFCQINNSSHYQLCDISQSKEDVIYLIDESLLQSSSYGDLKTWLGELSRFEKEALIPLVKMLKLKEIDEIIIHESAKRSYSYKKHYKYRFYRKIISLKDICVGES